MGSSVYRGRSASLDGRWLNIWISREEMVWGEMRWTTTSHSLDTESMEVSSSRSWHQYRTQAHYIPTADFTLKDFKTKGIDAAPSLRKSDYMEMDMGYYHQETLFRTLSARTFLQMWAAIPARPGIPLTDRFILVLCSDELDESSHMERAFKAASIKAQALPPDSPYAHIFDQKNLNIKDYNANR